jgi:hypothetical protein
MIVVPGGSRSSGGMGFSVGHASITITLDRYGHLFPGSENEAAELLDAYLERANTQAQRG